METYVSCRAEADSESTAHNYFSADHNDSLSIALLDHSESPAFSCAVEDVGSMAHRFRGEAHATHPRGLLRSKSCMRIQSMLISVLFVAPFSDGLSTKINSVG